ncbi:MAG: hypothetical protein ABI273_12590 [Lacunisphaera sp.]
MKHHLTAELQPVTLQEEDDFKTFSIERREAEEAKWRRGTDSNLLGPTTESFMERAFVLLRVI